MDSSVSRTRPRRSATSTNGTQALSDDTVAKSALALPLAAVKAIRRLDWHPSAPKDVLSAVGTDDPARVWKAWRRYLAHSPAKPFRKLLKAKRSPLAWALPAASLPNDANSGAAVLVELLTTNDRATRKRLAEGAAWNEIAQQWLTESNNEATSVARAIESLAWCHALVWLTDELSPEVWCSLFERLVSAATDSAALTLHSEPLLHQLYAGELPLTLAYYFPHFKNTRAMRKASRKALARGPADLLNGEGLPTWADLGIARPLLACWTRCAAIGRAMKRTCWDATAEEQHRWFVLASLRLTRRDGSQMLLPASANPSVGAWDAELFAAALRLVGSEKYDTLADVFLPVAKSKKADSSKPKRGKARETVARHKKAFPPASYHCEWSGVSVLRPQWQRGGTRVVLAFGAQHVQLEVCTGRDVLLSGEWKAEVTLDGRRLEPVGTWEESCWITNRWVDYVELQLPLAENVMLQRHIVLPRQDGFLMLADSIVGHSWRPTRRDELDLAGGGHSVSTHSAGNGTPIATSQNGDAHAAPAHTISYRGTLPLGTAITYKPEDDTREAILSGSRDRAMVMPLALPEWRTDPRVGSFTCADGTLQLRQSNAGASLVAPLFFDLRRKRFSGQRTWRQLTVGEERKIQPPDRAVGYRVHSGDEQWIVYRSLTPRGNRTLLSHNLSTEFLVARFEVFDSTGSVDPLVEIE
jgi:hypothetical protein